MSSSASKSQGNIHNAHWNSHFTDFLSFTPAHAVPNPVKSVKSALNTANLLAIQAKANVFEYNSCDVSFTAVKWVFNTPPYNPFEKILKTALLHYLHYLFLVLDKTSNAGLACVCMVSESEDQCRVCLNMFVQPAVNDSFTVGVCSRCVCVTAAKTYSSMHFLLSWLLICCFQNWWTNENHPTYGSIDSKVTIFLLLPLIKTKDWTSCSLLLLKVSDPQVLT